MVHTDADGIVVGTLLNTNSITAARCEEGHNLCMFASDHCIKEGATQIRESGDLTDLAWDTHILSTHTSGRIILHDWKRVIAGNRATVTHPTVLCTLQEEGPVSRCLFLPHTQAPKHSNEEETWTPCFLTASENNAVVTLWSAFTSNGPPPTKLQVFGLENPSTSYCLSVCAAPAGSSSLTPPSTMVVMADRMDGKIFAWHLKASWEATTERTQLVLEGCDYVVPFHCKYPTYSWQVRSEAGIVGEELDASNIVFDVIVHAYQSAAVQRLTLTSMMLLPPALTWTEPTPGVRVDRLWQNVHSAHVSEIASEDAFQFDEEYDVDDDDADDGYDEAPDASALPPPDGFASPSGSTLPTASLVTSSSPFANWLGNLAAAKTVDALPPPEPVVLPVHPVRQQTPPTSNRSGSRRKEETTVVPQILQRKIAPTFVSSSLPPVVLPSLPPVSTPSLPPVVLPSLPPVVMPSLPPVVLPSLPPVVMPSLPPVSTPSLPPVALQSLPPGASYILPPGAPIVNGDGIFEDLRRSFPDRDHQSLPPVTSQSLPPVTSQSLPPVAPNVNGDLILEEIRRVIREEMKTSLIPAVREAVQASVQESLIRPIQSSITELAKTGIHVDHGIISASLAESVDAPLRTAFADNMKTALIPALEGMMGQVFEQVSESLEKQSAADAASKNNNKNDLEAMSSQLTTVTELLTRLTTEFQTLRGVVENREATAAVRHTSPAVSTDSKRAKAEEVRSRIDQYCDAKQYEEGFNVSLKERHWQYTLYCCEKVDLKDVFDGETPKISQLVQLCIMQHLAQVVRLSGDVSQLDLSMKWLQELALSLHPPTNEIRDYLPKVLGELNQNIEARIQQGDQKHRHRDFNRILQFVRGIKLE
jgi:hypothetical protein